MPAAVGAAVPARDRAKIIVCPYNQTVGPRRSPRLQDPHLLDRSSLKRLLEARAAHERRRNPKVGLRGGHHPAAVASLAQDEFHQLISRREDAEPVAPARSWRESRGISWKSFQNRMASRLRSKTHDAMPPRLADQDVLP